MVGLSEVAGQPELGRECLIPYQGDVTDRAFRTHVFADMKHRAGPVTICVPAAGIVRDGLAVKVDKVAKTAKLYDQDLMEKTIAVNLIAATYSGQLDTARGNERFLPGEVLTVQWSGGVAGVRATCHVIGEAVARR